MAHCQEILSVRIRGKHESHIYYFDGILLFGYGENLAEHGQQSDVIQSVTRYVITGSLNTSIN